MYLYHFSIGKLYKLQTYTSASQGLFYIMLKKKNGYMYLLRHSNYESEILRHSLKTVG